MNIDTARIILVEEDESVFNLLDLLLREPLDLLGYPLDDLQPFLRAVRHLHMFVLDELLVRHERMLLLLL